MLSYPRKPGSIKTLIFAIGLGVPVTVTEAAPPQGDPENLASAIFFTLKVQSEFLYCFVDMEFFSYPATDNCEKSRVELVLLAHEMKLDRVDIQDDRIFLRVITKLFSIYNDRLSRGSR